MTSKEINASNVCGSPHDAGQLRRLGDVICRETRHLNLYFEMNGPDSRRCLDYKRDMNCPERQQGNKTQNLLPPLNKAWDLRGRYCGPAKVKYEHSHVTCTVVVPSCRTIFITRLHCASGGLSVEGRRCPESWKYIHRITAKEMGRQGLGNSSRDAVWCMENIGRVVLHKEDWICMI